MILKSNKGAILSAIFFAVQLIFASPCNASVAGSTNSGSRFSNTQIALMAVGATGLIGGLAALFLGGGKSGGETVDPVLSTTSSTTPSTELKITSTDPASAATDVALNQNIIVTFNKKINSATLNTNTFTVKTSAGDLVPGTVSHHNVTVLFTPASNFASNTAYVATITTDVKAIDDKTLASNYTWTFTTGEILSSKDTKDTKDTVAQDESILFDATLKSRGAADQDESAILTSEIDSTPNTPSSPNKLTAFFNQATQKFCDVFGGFCKIAPKINNTNPAKDAIDVGHEASIIVEFSEKMDPKTIDFNTFIVTNADGEQIDGVVTYDEESKKATFTNDNDDAWGVSAVYTVTLTQGVKNIKDNALAQDYSWSFTTEKDDELPQAPQVMRVEPAIDSINISPREHIVIEFDRSMNQTTLNTDTVIVINTKDNSRVAGSMAANQEKLAVFVPERLLESTEYRVTVTDKALDVDNKPLTGNYSWVFTTGAV